MAIYAVSDLHGRFDLYKQICDFLKPEDEVICLGDCGDRGPQSWETITAVYENPQWTYLMGNHEHMLVEAMRTQIRRGIPSKFYHRPVDLIIQNGGQETLNAWAALDSDSRFEWYERLRNLDYVYEYTNSSGLRLILTHAGFHPYDAGDFSIDEYDLVWDRGHIKLPWVNDPALNNVILVHGHTPCPYLAEKWTPKDGAIYYAGTHKVDIDMGSVWTGMACLFDLETFDEHYFMGEDFTGEVEE